MQKIGLTVISTAPRTCAGCHKAIPAWKLMVMRKKTEKEWHDSPAKPIIFHIECFKGKVV
jgi:hypothetical protein